ncbi:Origin recognition complex, subunit 1 [Trachipleistophora hominis]|uniref:Origin recognition complex, subunit 1 n=1 Tax=Trachipleistophora hominis TaxID=72359 RepID=L7JXA9_TRAHO|nr:Origin recognition complex, subunit 1 [Trachipleistophora hominis]
MVILKNGDDRHVNTSTAPFIRVSQRVHEQNMLLTYIKDFQTNGKGHVIYISGVPGSGKTYTVINTLLHCNKAFYFNCGSLKNKSTFFKRLYGLVNSGTGMTGCKYVVNGGNSVKNRLYDIENVKNKLDNVENEGNKCLVSNKKTTSTNVTYRNTNSRKRTKQPFTMSNLTSKLTNRILIIDEIDYLLTRNQHVLYTLFEMKTHTLLICISNTMAFTNKLDGKITSRIDFFINFEAYGADELREIVGVGRDDAFDLVVRRIAAVCGDVRKVEWYKRMLKRNGYDEDNDGRNEGTGYDEDNDSEYKGNDHNENGRNKRNDCDGNSGSKNGENSYDKDHIKNEDASKLGNKITRKKGGTNKDRIGSMQNNRESKRNTMGNTLNGETRAVKTDYKKQNDMKVIDQLMKSDKPVFSCFLNEIDEQKKMILRMGVVKYEDVCGMDYFEYERIVGELEQMGLVVNGKVVLTREEIDKC